MLLQTPRLRCWRNRGSTCLCGKKECCKATRHNRRERRARTYCGQLKEYPMLSIPPGLPTPLPPKYLVIFRADTSLFLLNFNFENLIIHIFLIIIIIIPCSGMFRNVPGCSMFLVLSTPRVLGEFSKVMQTLDCVSGLHNCLEFFKSTSCLDDEVEWLNLSLLSNRSCGPIHKYPHIFGTFGIFRDVRKVFPWPFWLKWN